MVLNWSREKDIDRLAGRKEIWAHVGLRLQMRAESDPPHSQAQGPGLAKAGRSVGELWLWLAVGNRVKHEP